MAVERMKNEDNTSNFSYNVSLRLQHLSSFNSSTFGAIYFQKKYLALVVATAVFTTYAWNDINENEELC